MSVLQAEVCQAFCTLKVPDEDALKAAVALSSALSKVEDETSRGFSKRDADIDAIREDTTAIKLDIVGLRGEIGILKWMGGVLITMVTAIILKLFLR